MSVFCWIGVGFAGPSVGSDLNHASVENEEESANMVLDMRMINFFKALSVGLDEDMLLFRDIIGDDVVLSFEDMDRYKSNQK